MPSAATLVILDDFPNSRNAFPPHPPWQRATYLHTTLLYDASVLFEKKTLACPVEQVTWKHDAGRDSCRDEIQQVC